MRRITQAGLVLALLATLTVSVYADGDNHELLLEKEGTHFTVGVPSEMPNAITLTPKDGTDAIKMTRLHASTENETVDRPDDLFVVLPLRDDGYAFLEVIQGAESQEIFKYKIEAGQGRQITKDQSGGYSILGSNKEGVVSMSDPWAYDMNGTPVPAQYTLENGVLTMTVDHQDGDYAYPIVADPCFTFWKSSCWSQITETVGNTAQSEPVQVLAAVSGVAAGVAASVAAGPAVGASTAAATYVQVVVTAGVVGGIYCVVTCDPY